MTWDLDWETLKELERSCTEYEAHCHGPQVPRVEPFLPSKDCPYYRAALEELLGLEIEYRHHRGELPSKAEYHARFPEFVRDIDRLFASFSRESDHDNHRVVESDGLAAVAQPVFRCPNCADAIDVTFENDWTTVQCPTCHTETSLISHFPYEAIVDEKQVAHYRLVERLGAGQFGTVWKAVDTLTGRSVALKLIPVEAADADRVTLSLRGVRAAARLQHPGIVPVIEFGMTGSFLYIVQELVSGVDFKHWLTLNHPTYERIAELVSDIAATLHEAHRQGIVHRDLKPANILIDAKGCPYLTDFGLSKIQDERTTLSVAGRVFGTLPYMSPEQARGDVDVDFRSDIYSLGVVLFECLTGSLPYQGSPLALIRQISDSPIPPPSSRRPGIPRPLESICLTCLQKEPRRRYSSAQLLAEDLQLWLQHEPISGRQATISGRQSPLRINTFIRRSLSWYGAIAGILLLLMLAICVAFFRGSHSMPVARPATSTRDSPFSSLVVSEPYPGIAAGRGLVPRPASLPGIRTWQLETIMPRATIYSIQWNPVGTHLACATASGAVRVYRVKEHEITLEAIYPADDIASRDIVWTRDGQQIVVVGERPQIALWAPFRGRLDAIWDSDFSGVYSVNLHPLLPLVATSGGDRHIRTYTLSGELRNEGYHGPTDAHVCKWSPDGTAIAIGNAEGAVQLWYPATNHFQPLLDYAGRVTTMEWHPEGEVLALGGEKNSAVFWSIRQGKIADISFDYPHVDKVVWHPSGQKVAVVSGDVHIYRFEDGKLVTPSIRIETEEATTAFAWHQASDTDAVFTTRDFRFFRWNGLETIEIGTETVLRPSSVAWNPQADQLAVTTPTDVRLINRDGSRQAVSQLDEYRSGEQLAFTADGQRLATIGQHENQPRSAFVWGTEHLELLANITGPHNEPTQVVSWDRTSQFLITANQKGQIQFSNLADNSHLPVLESGQTQMTCIAWHPHEQLVAIGGWNRQIQLWDLAGFPGQVPEAPKAIIDFNDPVVDLAWKSDSTRLAVAGHRWMGILDAHSEEIEWKRRADHVTGDATWAADGNHVAFSLNGCFVANSGERVTSWIDSVALDFHPTTNAVVHTDGYARIFVHDPWDGELQWIALLLRSGNTLTFHRDGSLLEPHGNLKSILAYLIVRHSNQLDVLSPEAFRAEFSKLHNIQ